MKTKHISYILALGLSLLLFSCENIIEFSGETTKPLLVVNSIISPDSLIRVHVSKSKFFLENTEATGYEYVNDATVNVWVNDVKTEKLTSIGNGFYLASFKPKPGDKIKITAENSEFSEVTTSTEVITPTQILAVDTTNHIIKELPMVGYTSINGGPAVPDTSGTTIFETLDVTVKFRDPAEISNYYKLNVRMLDYFDNDSTALDFVWIITNDMVFGNNTNALPIETSAYSDYYNNYEFSDEIFNGKLYDLKCTCGTTRHNFKEGYGYSTNKNSKTPIKQELIIELQSLSESYFKYIHSRSASSSTVEFFSEPVQIYSNVKGGIGILGSYSSSFYKIRIR